ncbi:glycosyltransferase [Millisia brevis]|uniref:glycosyltransferase n=1 Tax=Millisia brevis TaxID=264148 RepID=UPI001FDFA085|nr:glycosyltransferase family 2 protein [Millisia brevis]
MSVAAAATAVLNARTARLDRALGIADTTTEVVAICIPARDEADTLPHLLDDLRAQTGPHRLRVIVVDDGSTDGTAAIARARVAGDDRFRVETAPAEVIGKTAACRWAVARLETAADAGAGAADTADVSGDAPTVLIFVDADVRLGPEAIAAGVAELRRADAELLCPWPTQAADDPLGALLQPLLAWSWSTTLPLRPSEALGLPSMAVACGQFLVFDAAHYRRIGGHDSVVGEVAEDLAIARAVRRSGGRTIVRYSPALARCTMYRSAGDVRTGHRRWLAPSTGGAVGALGAAAHLTTTGLLPVIALLVGGDARVRTFGAIGYAATVAGRLVVRRAESGRRPGRIDLLSALGHPVAVIAELALLADSARAHRFGDVEWKGRRLGR